MTRPMRNRIARVSRSSTDPNLNGNFNSISPTLNVDIAKLRGRVAYATVKSVTQTATEMTCGEGGHALVIRS